MCYSCGHIVIYLAIFTPETHGEVEEGEPPLPGRGRGLADEGRLPGVHQGAGGVREEDHSGLAVQHHLRAHHEAQAAIAGKA